MRPARLRLTSLDELDADALDDHRLGGSLSDQGHLRDRLKHLETVLDLTKTACRRSSSGADLNVTKNCAPLVSLPALAMDNSPGRSWRNVSSSRKR